MRIQSMRGLLVALAVGLCASCASDVANRYYGSTKYPPKPIDQVQLLSKQPDRPFDVIADFQSRGESPRDMQKHAAAIGADAVIVTTIGGRYGDEEEWAEQQHDRDTYTHITGTAIKFK